ncbi:flavin reductase family protein [Streptomyces sp. NPDC051218]|uniref:flavin reductase family protein n=1 Tax=Streptomyces sp. NPDC051218 TaxID=3365645 RepID=UPI0037A9730F
MGQFATGVAVVSAAGRGPAVGMTINSLASLSLEPPLISLAVGHASNTWPQIRQQPGFSINILSSQQQALCRAFATPSGRRFSDVDWTLSEHGTPIISGVLAWLHCEIEHEYAVGDHWLVASRVIAARNNSSASGLIFFRSGFRTVGPLLTEGADGTRHASGD